MSAEKLRRASSDIRAEWLNDDHTSDGRCKFPKSCLIAGAHSKFGDGPLALAVADLLDAQAKWIEVGGDFSDIEGGGDANALAVARAYLNEVPS